MRIFHRHRFNRRRHSFLATCALTLVSGASAATTLSDIPVGTASSVPANLIMTLSVEYPTGTVAAYKGTTDFSTSLTYLGYFDNTKCYDYKTDTTNNNAQYFVPVGNISSGSCVDSSNVAHWSGAMLNWATMTALDEFRQALTGGNRALPSPGTATNGDTTSLTVLLRSKLNSQSSSGNFPDKQIGSVPNVAVTTVIGDTTFSNTSLVYIRNYKQNSQFEISDNSGFQTQWTDSSGQSHTGLVVTYNAAVQVCKANMLESNCNANPKNTYPNSGKYNKPEGLIQQNYQRIRVGAAAYLYQKGNTAPGNGVIRALARDNGPDTYNGTGARGYAPCSATNQNPNSEWDCMTGVFSTNPYPDSAGNLAPGGGAATTSGAINYLNKFGYNNGYEQYDNIGDLYWAALAYLMHVPLDTGYTSAATASNTMDVNFPMYTGTSLNDPVKYSCQANAIVTIGDSHTWWDTYVPSTGSPPAASSPNQSPLTPVNGADAGLYATKLGNLPLVESTPATTMASVYTAAAKLSTAVSLGNVSEPNGTTDATYNMAGLAYFAHTQDIRPAPTAAGTTDPLPGKQTVDTYTVDVLEPGGYDGNSNGSAIYNPGAFKTTSGGPGPNVYWLAAKYGGFNDINGDGKPANFLTWHTNNSTAANYNLRPDNYFPGNQPDLLQNGLKQIFNKVSTTPQSAAGPGINVSRILTNVVADSTQPPYYSPVAGFPIYTVSYTPSAWVGDVQGYVATATVPGSVTPVSGSQTWSAQGKLDALAQATGTTGNLGWNTGRRIISYSGTGPIPFRWSNLSSAEQTALGSNGSTLLNYLRGDQSKESSTYRARLHILGDIVHSEPVLVQNALSPKYSDSFNPGYSAFSTTVASRAPVVYAGANDGMLHAFEGDFSVPSATATNQVTGGGSELFAYVPSFVYNGPTSTPQTNGLQALSILNGVTQDSSSNYLSYAHHFYVDATPTVADVDFNYTYSGGTPYTSAPAKSTATTASWKTILVGGLGKGGKGYYALNITTVPSAIDAKSSTAATEQTLATSTVLWEFTATDMGYSYGPPLVVKTRKYGWVVLFTSGYDNPSGNGHLYIVNPTNGTLLETLSTTVGTASSPSGLTYATGFTKDITDNTVEQVYAGDLLGNVWRFDLSGTGTYPAPTLLATLTAPDGSVQPVTTAPRIELDLNSNQLDTRRWVFVGTGQALDTTDLNSTQVETMYALRDGDSATPSTTGLPIKRQTTTLHQVTDLKQGVTMQDTDAGWFYDLTGSAGTNGGTERIVIDPDAAAGVYTLTWATMTPTTDPCTLAGNIYAVSYGSGASVLVDSSGNQMAYQTVASAPTKIEQVQLPGTTTLALLYGQATGAPQMANMRGGSNNQYLQRVNWREVLSN
ncbi:pilus assembly protein [Dyella japonica]|uniref:PilY1 beta-propeller domain-containing protein n=1 Tax=Dyella japonica A8 TaxID=1217721 RepID=A0A075JZP2_9GAMM|nr:PilC/PilY family type IV pilus protein [Dyella japonica]AIF47399.1 hypothetical protein HY57_09000 [Dyella japonica A8]